MTYFSISADYSVLLLRGLICLWLIDLEEIKLIFFQKHYGNSIQHSKKFQIITPKNKWHGDNKLK